MKSEEFNKEVIATLAEHGAKLDEIFARLKSIDRTLSHNMGRVNTLETGFAFMKGMTALLGSVLTIFIGLVAYLK
jgi:division protein CdvB (Snf7/Vps24/ESCRT-III family)